MREANAPLTWSGAATVSMAATSHSDPIFCSQESMIAIQLVWAGGSPVGDFTLETSMDEGNENQSPATGITHWTTYTSSTHAAGGAAGNYIYRITDLPDRWVRLVYSFTSDTGTLSGRFQLKGTV